MRASPVSAGPSERRTNAARLFGYDVFISFALGPPPRGSRSYASDLARRLRERDFTVFFSEEEAAAGDQLDATLKRALSRSRILVVIVNAGTLAAPHWVQTEVEEFRREHPERPIIPINIGNALQDPILGPGAEGWLRHSGKIWIDEGQSAADEGVVSDSVLERLATAPNALRAGTRWRWTVRAAFVVLAAVTATALWFAWFARLNAEQARDNAEQARLNEEQATRNANRARENERRAVEQRKRAEDAEEAARTEAKAARTAERLAEAGRVAAESQLARQSDPRAALLLAREAWNLDPTMEARRALYAALSDPVPIRLGKGLGELRHAALSADGGFIAVSGADARIHLWNAATHRAAGVLRAQSEVNGIAFSPDGRTLASLDSQGRLQFWEPGRGQARGDPLVTPDMTRGWAVAWSPDGQGVAVAGVGRDFQEHIFVWDVASRALAGESMPTSENYGTFALAFSPDGKLLAATTLSAIQVWDVATRRLHVPPIPARSAVRRVAFLDDDTIVFDGPDYAVMKWDLSDNAGEAVGRGHMNWVGALAYAPEARITATGSEDLTIRLWRGDGLAPWGGPLRGHDMGVNGLALHRDGTQLVSAGRDGQVIQWLLNRDAHRFRRVVSGSLPSREDGYVTVSDDGRWLVFLDSTGRLEWHDLPAGRRVAAVATVRADRGLAVARDGTVALRTEANGIALHQRGEARARCSVAGESREVTFSADSRLFVTVERSGAGLWRAQDCRAVAAFPFEDNGRSTFLPLVVFSGDGRSLLLGDGKGVRRWSIAARRFEGGTAAAHADSLCIAGDAAGRFVASGHGDGVIRVTRTGGKGPPISLQGPHGHSTLRALAFSPDGSWLASVADDGRAVLWVLTTNQPVGPPIETGQGQLRFVGFSADGQTLVTTGTDGPPARWQLDGDSWSAQACRTAQRNLTCAEWKRMLGDQPYRKTCPALPLPDDAADCALSL